MLHSSYSLLCLSLCVWMHLPLSSQEKSGNVFTSSQTNMLLIAKLILILCTKYATQGFGFEFPKICLFWKGAVSYPTLPVFCTPSFKCWRILNPTALQEGKGRGVFKVKNIVIWRQSIAKTRFSSIGIEWPGLCSRAGLSELWTPVNFMWVTMTIGRVFSSIGQVVSSISCE